jgi:hypothetical protein
MHCGKSDAITPSTDWRAESASHNPFDDVNRNGNYQIQKDMGCLISAKECPVTGENFSLKFFRTGHLKMRDGNRNFHAVEKPPF